MAAGNLVAKAVRARMRGDADRAAVLVERAVQLPYDDHEDWWPALQAVSMALFDAVTDDLEAAEEDDQRWLDRALAVHARSAGIGRQELAHVLDVVAQDYHLNHGEQRRLRAVRREVDGSSEGLVFEWGPDASLDDRRRVTLAVLDVVVDHAGARSAAARV